jgi:hypothetical protein
MIWQALLTFVSMVALDVVWANYTLSLVAKKAVLASFFASAILLFNSAVVLSYVDHPVMILPAMAGAFVGTFAATKWRTDNGQDQSRRDDQGQ